MTEGRRVRAVIAVTLACMTLLSMFTFAGAAQTGGTTDQVFEENRDVGDYLNLGSNSSATLVEPNPLNDNVTIADDGRIKIAGASGDGTFEGVTLSLDRIDAVDDVGDTSKPASFLDNVSSEFNVSANATEEAVPVVFIELDPRSEFSQINGTERVDGSHDYIVVAPANVSSSGVTAKDQLNGTVDTNLNATLNNDISQDDIVALSVDNNGSGNASSSLLENESDFGSVFDALVGSAESDLQNKNIDDVQFAAGTFDSTPVSINEIELADNIEADTEVGETIHSEKITLIDGTEETFFSSVSEAANASTDDADAITVDKGNYSTLEGQNVTIDTDVTVNTTNRVNAGDTIDRVDASAISPGFDDPASEAILNTTLVVNASATIDNLAVNNGSDPAVALGDVNGQRAALENVIVNYTSTGTAVNTTNVTDAAVNGSALVANSPKTFAAGEVGLELNGIDAGNTTVDDNYFVGFETQVANTSTDSKADTIFDQTNTGESAVQSAVPFSGGSANASAIHGSINLSDSAAGPGDVINVSAGTYSQTGPTVVATDEISVVGAGTSNSLVADDVLLNSSTSVTFQDFEVSGDTTAVADGNTGATVTIDNVDVSDDNLLGHNITVEEGDDVTVQSVTFDDAGASVSMLNVSADLAATDDTNQLSVTDVTIQNLTGTGILAPQVGDDVTVNNNDISGNANLGLTEGVNISEIGSSGSPAILVENNIIDTVGNGTAIILNETASDRASTVDINDNTLTAKSNGTNFTGLEYNLDDTKGTNITNNTIIGTNVRGGSTSNGILFVNVTVSGTQALGGPTGGLRFNENSIIGHARVITSQDSDAGHETFDGILASSRNNEFGTLVVSGDESSSTQYSETYGKVGTGVSNADTTIDLSGATVTFLPGSVSQANVLLNNSDTNNPADLQVFDPTDVAGPDKYVDEVTDIAARDGVVIVGEDDSVTVQTRFVINNSDSINNHTIEDLTVNNTDSEPAINITDGDNSQSEFRNLDVTSSGAGLVVNSTEDDVNFVEVYDSSFEVQTDGFVLADSRDDRDGFIINNVSLTGSGVSNPGTGLDATDLDFPGKEDPNLGTKLDVVDSDVNDFQVQINLSNSPIADINTTNVEEIVENNVSGPNLTSDVNISNNEFSHAVLIYNETNGSTDLLMENATLYGSIDTAEARVGTSTRPFNAPNKTAIVEVRTPAGERTVYDNSLTLGETTTPNDVEAIEIRGPAFGTQASSSFRPGVDEAVIESTNGSVAVDTDGTFAPDNVTLDGFTVVGNEEVFRNQSNFLVSHNDGLLSVDTTPQSVDRLVHFDNSENVMVNNTAITMNAYLGVINDAAPTVTLVERPEQKATPFVLNATAVEVSSSANVSLNGVFVGNHDAGSTTVDSLGVTDGTANVTVSNSNFTSNVTIDGTGINGISTGAGPAPPSAITGVQETTIGSIGVNASTAESATVDVSDSSINDHGANGLKLFNNTFANVTLNDTTISVSGGDGVNISDASSSSTATLESGSVVEDSSKIGVNVTSANAEVNVNTTEVRNSGDDGIALDATNLDPAVTNSTIESSSGVALNITASAGGNTLNNTDANATGNSFLENGVSINLDQDPGDGTFNATLNYYNVSDGPENTQSDSITGGFADTVVYDPFLTDETATIADVENTTSFGHDVVAPANSVVSVGFPAQPEDGSDTTAGAFDENLQGTLYKFENGQFTQVQVDDSNDIEAFDAFVLDHTNDSEETAALIEYEADPAPGSLATYEYEEGVNFVAPAAAGNVSDVLIPGGDTDFVQVGTFQKGENLYGTGKDNQTRDSFTSPAEPGFGGNFRGNVGGEEVHPHTGYFVIVNEESNVNLTIGERIMAGGAPTASDIDEKTDETSD